MLGRVENEENNRRIVSTCQCVSSPKIGGQRQGNEKPTVLAELDAAGEGASAAAPPCLPSQTSFAPKISPWAFGLVGVRRHVAQQVFRQEDERRQSDQGICSPRAHPPPAETLKARISLPALAPLFWFWWFLIVSVSLFVICAFGPQVVREHYLRDDIYCGASICKACDSSAARLSESASPILILDTNVVLHQVQFAGGFSFFSMLKALSLLIKQVISFGLVGWFTD